ncbi:MAG: cell surface protein SprA [Gemmatimonadetes bacterium 13_2_20CM_2_69_23]|nr:MAG: cell surface protein SprA [Gemmatimonadetes bacterium 13_2_20CM_2_69_23]PYO30754.1 MAG: cell surface protein SprA [Gemmatimonadota bacterium]
MRRPTLVGLVALSLVIPQAYAQDTTAVRVRPPRPPGPPGFRATFSWTALAPPRLGALLPGGRLGLRTSPAAVAAAWARRVRAARRADLAVLPQTPVAVAESAAAAPEAPAHAVPPAGLRGILGTYADIGMELRVRFELKADRFRNLKCTPFEQQQALSGCQTRFPTISPVPQYAVRTAGIVGRRLHVNVDFDSQREFDANNNLQVWYEGLEDEVLRRVEAGNVTFQAPPSRFISAAIPANNFGVQAIAQLGALELRGIYAQQKGNVVRDRVYAVGETTTQPIDRVARDLDYEAGRFFFAVDPALVPRYPAVDVLSIDRATMPDSLRVGSVRVYRVRAASPTSTTNQNIGGVRAVACGPGPSRSVDCDVQRAGPFQWELLLEGKDYYVDPSGAWFALAARLDQSDYLAVSYIPVGAAGCGPGGRCVGTFPAAASRDTAVVDTLRLVYDPRPGVTAATPSFRFEIRSAYRVGGSDVDRTTVALALTVNQRERTILGAQTYLAQLGMALESDPTRFDQYNRLFPRTRDPQQGAPLRDYFAVFPHLTPFADSTRLAPGERNDSLYRTPRLRLLTQSPPSVFALGVHASVAASSDRSQLSLNSFQIRDGSEKIYVGSRLLTRDADYGIDYATGQVTFKNPDSLFQGGTAQVRAQFEERAAFAVAPTSIYGLAARYDLGHRGTVNFTGLFQKEQSAFTRPPLGFEPSSSFIGGVSTELHFQPEFVTRALNALPGIHTEVPSLLNISAEVATSRPSPNQAGQAYVEEFEAEAGRPLSLAENSWHWGSVPTTARGAEPFGIDPSGFAPANAAALTWQNLPLGADGRAIQFLPQQIDPTIRLVGQAQSAEQALWLMLKPDTVLGLADVNTGNPNWVRPHQDGPRWRSITQALSATGIDLSRTEYLELWVWEDNHRVAKSNHAALVLDFGSVFEDALAWVPDAFRAGPAGDTTYYGRRYVGLGRLDTERDPITHSWNAVINDEGILADRVTDGIVDSTTGAVRDTLPLCSATQHGLLQTFFFGDLRSRCGRHNGFVDTEDLDGDFRLDSVAGVRTVEGFVRFVFPIGDERFYVRDGAMLPAFTNGLPDGTSGWRLYRIPFRTDTIQVGRADLRQIQSLRVTVVAPHTAGPNQPDPQVYFGLARVRLVGASWLKRADTPIRGVAGERGTGTGEVIASVVSTENRDLGYTPPPGVFDEAGRRDANLQLATAQINERSLRLLAGGLQTGQRAEAFLRFTAEGDKNFLKYRRLRTWMRGRGPGWEDGDLHAYIKAGKDQDNFYLYHAPARTISWDPEMVVDLDRWLLLRAKIEQAWLRGDTAQIYAGCPDTSLVPFDSAYVMCDGPYLAHVRDPATAPPNLAAVQEIAAGIWRVNSRVFLDQAELWVDDIRLSDVVQDAGFAGAIDVTLTAANVADVAVSVSRRDAQFRQLGEDPRYVADNAASVAGTVRLERFFPDRWGIIAPLSVRYAATSSAPFYLAGTDLRADALTGLRTPRATAASYALTVRRTRRSPNAFLRYLVDPLAVSGAYARGTAQGDLALATSSSYAFNLDYALALGPPGGGGGGGGGGIRLAPAAVRFHSGLAGDEGSRLTYAVPVARVADSGLAPALSRNRVWRNSGGLDFLPLRGLQLRVDAASVRDLRDYGDSTTIARLMRQERRTFLGQDVGVETQRTITTAVTATPQVGAWLRPRAAVSTTFSFTRDPNGRTPVRDVGDTAGGFHLPAAFSNQRRLDLAVGVDPRRLGGKLFGDSAALARLLGRLTNLDLSYGRTLLSSYDRVPGGPSFGYQFAIGRFDGFRSQSGRLALAATDNSSLNAGANAALPEGMRVNMNYRRTRGITWALRLDQQVPIRSASTEWPSANLSWSVSPGTTALGRVLTSLSAQLGYRKVATASDQPSFLGAEAPAATSSGSERSIRPALALTWRHGVSTAFDASYATSDQVSAGNAFHTERSQQSASLAFVFRPPASIVRLKHDIRAAGRYSASANKTCLQAAGQEACVPYVDSRQTQMQLSLDTDLPPTLSAGFQMAYLVNDERQANRKTSQLVITAFVELHTSVGQIQ